MEVGYLVAKALIDPPACVFLFQLLRYNKSKKQKIHCYLFYSFSRHDEL